MLETLARDVAWGEVVTYGELAGMRAAPCRRGRWATDPTTRCRSSSPCHRACPPGGRIGGYGGGRNADALRRELLAREGVTGLRNTPVTGVSGRV